MLISYQRKNMKKQKNFLPISALILSFILCAAVFFVGYTKFLGLETEIDANYPAFLNQFPQIFNFINIKTWLSGKYPTFPDKITEIFIGILYLIVNILYVLWLFQAQRNYSYKGLKFFDLVKLCFPFLALAFISYPLGNDIYLYLQYGLMALNNYNPFLLRAGGFSSELYEFIRWYQTSTYGPVSLAFFVISAAFVPVSKILAIYLFKGFCLAAHLLNGYLVFRLLKKYPYSEIVTLAYLCNPLILFEQVGSAHVDVFVCTTFLFLIFCFKYKHYLVGMLTIWLGFMAKTLPILWLPLGTAFLIQQRRWYSLILAVIGSLAIVGLLTITVLPTKEAWWSLLNPGVSDTLGPLADTMGSFHRILATYLRYWPNLTSQFKMDIIAKFKLFTYAIFGAYYLVTLIQIPLRRRYSEDNLGLDIGWVSLLLFVLATPWLMPWYASTLLPATALNIDDRRFALTSLAFSMSSASHYALLSTGVFHSWFVVGFPILILGLDLIIPRSQRYVV